MKNGRREAIFKQWLAQHKNLMLKIVRAYADLPSDQDDLFQEILLQLWISIPNFQQQAKETTWIYRVALNTALVWKRREIRKRKHQKHKIKLIEIELKKPTPNHSGPDQQVLDQLYGAIRKLSKIDGSLVLMCLDGLSYQDMADVLGISKNHVGVKLNRAKKELAKLLEGLIDDF